jgi:SAM-dependent methyltransferase
VRRLQREVYEALARHEARHWWYRGRRAVIAAVLGDERAGRVLDVGTGAGGMLELLGRYGDAQGVDADPEAVRAAAGRRVELYDGSTLPFGDGTFGLVTAFDVIEHVDDDVALLREMKRVTRSGGCLVVAVPALPALWGAEDVVSHHRRRYVRRGLVEALTAAGLRVERATYFNTLLLPPIAAVRLFWRVVPAKGEPRSDCEIGAPGPLNDLLARVFAAEARVLARRDLPLGASLIAVARC